MDERQGTLKIGDVLQERYQVVREGKPQDIGTAYEAYDLRYERSVVVLLLAPRYFRDGDAPRRLRTSQQEMIDLAVPELVPVEDAGVAGGQLYLVRSLVAGYTLAAVQARIGRLDPDVAERIAIGICDALSPLHHAGLVHGSLSPYSVLVQDSGEVLLTDARLMPVLRPPSLSAGHLWGRAPYLSPEQAAGDEVHPSSDVYVIGCLLYEMLAGRPPFQGRDEAVLAVRHLRHDPPSLQVLIPDVSQRLADIVQKCLMKEPSARYRNAGQLASILRSQVGPGRPGPFLSPPATPAEGLPSSSPRAAIRPRATSSAQPRPAIPTESLPMSFPQRREPLEAATQARERLIVPPPPPGGIHRQEEYLDDWAEESERVDWLILALAVLALIAVLGLIPLWRTVYRLYAAPPASPPASLYQWPQSDWADLPIGSTGLVGGATPWSKLDDFGLVWYNLHATNQSILTGERALPGRIAWFGSQDYDFWEQSVLDCECNE